MSRIPDRSEIELDLYFLIARFLSQGPCQESAGTLIQELENNGLLHRNITWTGELRRPNFAHSLSTFQDVAADYLFQICQRIGPLLNKSLPPPSVAKPTLCGLGRHSLLRNEKTVSTTSWGLRSFSASIAGRLLVPPHNFTPNYNWALGVFGREHGGSKFKNLLRPAKTLYGKMKLHRRVLGHLSSVYCILYDRTGSRIFTGSDDCLIKCWSAHEGRLLSTFRGHQSEICDMDISYENTIMASASCDKEIRIWDIRSGKPVTILQSHSAMITSIEFSAMVQGETRYLISTGRDGNVCFWIWNSQTLEFATQPIKFQERNRPGVAMLCSSCSAGGRFIAVGGSDNLVHIYQIPFESGTTMIGPMTIAEQDEHKNTVDSIWFSHSGLRLISGSKDGTARVWSFEYSTWSSLVLHVSRTHNSPLDPPSSDLNAHESTSSKSNSKTQTNNNTNKINVIMVAWDCKDENVVTSLTDYTIKVWNSRTRHLRSILKGHTDEAYCLEPHPNDKRILLSAGHDGNVFLWNVDDGSIIMNFHNMLEGLGHGAVFDAKFSRDGDSFACTDSHGHVLLFDYGDGKPYMKSPVQQFFHTDYRPLIRDQQGYVLDEQTQQAPHLMPPPFLVDVDGNPYPSALQRLVPGREHASDAQTLLPDFIAEQNGLFSPGEDFMQQNNDENEAHGVQQEPEPAAQARSVLDTIIEQMQRGENEGELSADPAPFSSPSSAVGLRREGDLAGVRQMHRNAPRSQVASIADIMALTQRVITPQFSQEECERRDHIRQRCGATELALHRKERRRRRPTSHRRLSRDAANQQGSSKCAEVARKSSQRRPRSNFFKDDPEDDQEEETSRSSRRRLIRKLRTHDHGYSTRSTAPTRRMSSVAESVHEESLEDIEECSTSATGETSDFMSSEEDFSQKAKIIRRSKRKKKASSRRKEKTNDVSPDVEKAGLRRSGRHRRAPKRLENSSEGEFSDVDDETTENTASTGSLFLSPKSNRSKRTKQKRKLRAQRMSSTASSRHDHLESSDEEDKRPSTSSNYQSNSKVQLRRQTTSKTKNNIKKVPKKALHEIPFDIIPGQPPPPMYLPPDWIKRITPSHFPYVPQMDDEIVYIRQGHEAYISKVVSEKVWLVDESELCYNQMEIGYAEPCKVIEIDYIVGPPTLCEICLLPLNQKISKNSKTFRVKFHDMPNVVDFLILKDKYDASVSRTWAVNDRFRSIIDDSWWYGVIVDHTVRDLAYPESHFQSFSVLWDSENTQEELDYLSPWDMEVIPGNISNLVVTRSQNSQGNSSGVETATAHAALEPNELRNVISYRYKRSDWSGDDPTDSDDENDSVERKMTKECVRLANGIQTLINEKEFAAFASPVNVATYPLYVIYVAFPTDLSTILQRLQNHFYRRSAAVSWEISCLEKNANAFNEPNSVIVNRAEFLCSLLTKFMEKKSCTDIIEIQHELEDRDIGETDNSESDADMSSDSRSSGSSIPSMAHSGTEDDAESGKSILESQEVSEYTTTAGEEDESNSIWVGECEKLLHDVLGARDSRPFRSRVAQHENDIEPLDLITIQNKLLTSKYSDPNSFLDDVTQMFLEFKRSNQSREGGSMMARLSPLMTSRIDIIIKEWKKTQTKVVENGVRRSKRRRTRRVVSDSWSPNSKSVSQESDSFVVPRPRSNAGSTIGAYPTRQMLRRHAQRFDAVENGEDEEAPSRNLRQNHRKLRSRRLQTVDTDDGMNHQSESEDAESAVVTNNHINDSAEIENDENTSETNEQGCSTRALKRRLSDDASEEIGQGDASITLRRRKRQKTLKSSNHETSSDSEKHGNSDSDYSINNEVQKSKKHSKTNGHHQGNLPANPHTLRAKRRKPSRYNEYSDFTEEDTEYEVSKSRNAEPDKETSRSRRSRAQENNKESSDDSDYEISDSKQTLEKTNGPHSRSTRSRVTLNNHQSYNESFDEDSNFKNGNSDSSNEESDVSDSKNTSSEKDHKPRLRTRRARTKVRKDGSSEDSSDDDEDSEVDVLETGDSE